MMINLIRISNIFLSLFLFIAQYVIAGELTGKVIRIADGDTLTVLSWNRQYKVRLVGIDAPEKGQSFGNVSRKSLSDMTFGKTVKVDWEKKDKYGRILGRVSVDGLDVNYEQLKSGMAWFYRKYESDLPEYRRHQYSLAEMQARNAKLGLWCEYNPKPPWEYRHGEKDYRANSYRSRRYDYRNYYRKSFRKKYRKYYRNNWMPNIYE